MPLPVRRNETSSRPMQRWDPFREFEQLQEEMGRLVQTVWSPANGDGGAWTPCTSPKTYTLLTPGTHEFDVRASDQAGNTGDLNGWKWTINGLSGSGMPFTIGGNAASSLYPNGATQYIDLSL